VLTCHSDVVEEYRANVWLEGTAVAINLTDTDAEGLDVFRPPSYLETDVFLLCFSVASEISFQNIKTKWLPEVTHHCPAARLILLATKTDLREDPHVIEELKEKGLSIINTERGEQLASEINAIKYLECSALNTKSIAEVFGFALRCGLPKKSKAACLLM
jgi:small GTP-binding protein